MDYRELLRAELRKRQLLTPKYSLRDFARSLGLSPAHVSYLLRGLRGLSKQSANEVASALGVHNEYKRAFYLSVIARSARIQGERKMAARALQRPVILKALRKLIEFTKQKSSWRHQVDHLSKPTSFECHLMWRRMTVIGLC